MEGECLDKSKEQRDLVHSTDWGLLIILDNCRYDCFKRNYRAYLKGKLLRIESPAGDTNAWFKKIFSDYYDAVYIAGSAGAYRGEWRSTDHFRATELAFDWGWESIDDIRTVPPWNVSKAVRMAVAKYPSKKIVAHYVQPHYPFIGDPKFVINTYPSLAAQLLSNSAIKTLIKVMKSKSPWIKELVERTGRKADEALSVGSAPYPSLLRKGIIDIEFFKKAYEGNLNLVLRHVNELVGKIKKYMPKIIVTSDHGELFRYPFGHSDDLDKRKFPELYEVPWLILEDIVHG